MADDVVRTTAFQHDISSQLLAESPCLKMTETESGLTVEATLDEVMFDQLRAAYLDTPMRFVYPEPTPAVPPTRIMRVRRRIARAVHSLAWRIAPDDDEGDDWDD